MSYNLCGAEKGCCPEVDFKGDTVEIGEAGNLCKLKKAEWNKLVEGITTGTLKKL